MRIRIRKEKKDERDWKSFRKASQIWQTTKLYRFRKLRHTLKELTERNHAGCISAQAEAILRQKKMAYFRFIKKAGTHCDMIFIRKLGKFVRWQNIL